MSPTQAREIIEAAGERIADWKSRLRITTGNGVNTWDNQGSQLVSVSTSAEEVVKGQVNLEVILWASLRRVQILDPIDIPPSSQTPGYRLDEGGVLVNFKDRHEYRRLEVLQSGQYVDEASYKNSDELVPSEILSGYYLPKYTGDSFNGDYRAEYSPVFVQTSNAPGGFDFQNNTTSTVTIELSIRAYTLDYLTERSVRGLDPEFSKGKSIGSYDLMIRQEDAEQGPYYYTEGDLDNNGNIIPLLTYSTNPILTSTRRRIGFEPTTLTFTSRRNGYNVSSPGWYSAGVISIMGYRKV